jgi:hypothetical protein
VEVQFTLDRATAAEGALSRSVGVASAAAGGGAIELRAIVERGDARIRLERDEDRLRDAGALGLVHRPIGCRGQRL